MRCQAIHDPTRRLRRRGHVVAGALSTGAGSGGETSPALLGSGVEGGYAPADLRSAYALPASAVGNGQTVAVVAAHDDPTAESDLSAYRVEYGLPACGAAGSCFRKVDQTGGSGFPTPDPKWAEEISLDLDMVSAMCPQCHILLVEAKSTQESDLATAEDTAATLGATAIDDSFLGAEAPEYAADYDHPGIPIAAAGGDSGYGVQAPAAYPGVIAVGGTSLRPAAGRRGWSETVWSQSAGKGTGSGCSNEPKPGWQTDTGCAHRTTNDVSAVADPNTPVSVYDSYETAAPHWLLLGGTSVAAPIVAATMAMATPYTRSFDGAQALYLEVTSDSGGFNDVVEGSNGNCSNYLCRAAVGYDGPSGLGTPFGVPDLPVPAPVTGAASSIGATDATLQATVDTHGAGVSSCRFEYGPTATYGMSVPCSSLPGQVNGAVPVSAGVSGLGAGAEYHFRLVIEYPTGPGTGDDAVFATLGSAPTVSTLAASNATISTATLNGSVDPNGPAILQCTFEYGPTAEYGASVPCSASPGGGNTPIPVSSTLAGLKPGALYHYRLLGSSLNGSSYGADRTVTALPLLPTVVTGTASVVTASSATLNGTVDTGGAPLTSCAFEFNNAETLIPCVTLPPPEGGPVAVSAPVSGLQPGAVFNYRLLATNAGGSSYAAIQQFTTLLAAPLEPVLPIQTPIAPGPYRAVLTSRSIRVRFRNSVLLHVRCPVQIPRCSGRVSLRTLPGHKPHSSAVTLASGTFSSKGMGGLTVTLHLSAQAERLLKSAHTLRAIATVVTIPSTGPPGSWSAAVSLRAPAPAPTAKRA